MLIEKCKLQNNASVPDGYHLSVEIVASAIQSVPEAAVKAAWGENFSINADGSLNVPANGSEVTGE